MVITKLNKNKYEHRSILLDTELGFTLLVDGIIENGSVIEHTNMGDYILFHDTVYSYLDITELENFDFELSSDFKELYYKLYITYESDKITEFRIKDIIKTGDLIKLVEIKDNNRVSFIKLKNLTNFKVHFLDKTLFVTDLDLIENKSISDYIIDKFRYEVADENLKNDIINFINKNKLEYEEKDNKIYIKIKNDIINFDVNENAGYKSINILTNITITIDLEKGVKYERYIKSGRDI